MPLMMGIRNLSFNDKSQESWTWNSESKAWNPESESVLLLGFPSNGGNRKTIVVKLKLNGWPAMRSSLHQKRSSQLRIRQN